MNLIVLLKQTFDTEEKIVIESGAIAENSVEYIVNPYDEYAIEEAIQLREAHGGEITVISVGPDRAEAALRTALAMGADKAVLVDDEGLATDEYSTALILAEVLREREYDIILGGNLSIDNGSGQIGPRLADLLQISQVTTITKLSIENDRAVAVRDVEGDSETIEVPLPVVVTAQQGLNEPRYPSLPNIMKAKKKPLERLTLDDLSIEKEHLRPRTAVVETFLLPKKEAGRVLAGAVEQQVQELANLLRTEANVL
ncbi:electron transfer flavoprotein subunit beta/FixA family protein [Brevibacillus sp. NRS-1366]|uniref:electron transfer flavoprotein subunit beta/FixA family protein n=1 Tax=Brevibacillus sp. NRS-1366 TaxID=3233899 RepID=UPI003D252841